MRLKKKNGKMVADHKEEYEKKKSGVKKPTSAKTFPKSKLMKKGGSYSY